MTTPGEAMIELVMWMRVGDQAWIVPISEHKHYRPSWLRARLAAWRWNRRAQPGTWWALR